MAPEIIKEDPIGTRSDIWSLGMTMLELATAKNPWPEIKDLGELWIKIEKSEQPKIPEHLSSVTRDFILQCL